MARYGRVEHKANRVLIVAGGPSAEPVTRMTFPDGVHVIGVNGAADWLPAMHAWVTVDPCTENRQRMRNKRGDATYYAAVPSDYGTRRAQCSDHRAEAERGIVWLRRMTGFGPLGARAGLSADPSGIHTGNSAYGALGVALHMRARRVVLVGVDGNRVRRVDGGTPHSLTHLPDLFASARDDLAWSGCEVVNASPGSTVSCFPRMPLQRAMRWIAQ